MRGVGLREGLAQAHSRFGQTPSWPWPFTLPAGAETARETLNYALVLSWRAIIYPEF